MDKETFWKLARAKGFTQSSLARELNITQAAVGQWQMIPVERVRAVSGLIDIPPHELRPDIFPAPEREAGKVPA